MGEFRARVAHSSVQHPNRSLIEHPKRTKAEPESNWHPKEEATRASLLTWAPTTKVSQLERLDTVVLGETIIITMTIILVVREFWPLALGASRDMRSEQK